VNVLRQVPPPTPKNKNAAPRPTAQTLPVE
jgi:hypothetical protein